MHEEWKIAPWWSLQWLLFRRSALRAPKATWEPYPLLRTLLYWRGVTSSFFFFYFGGACIEDENKFCQILEQRSLPCRMSCFWAVQIFMKNAPLQATWVGILELSFIIFLMLFNKLFLHRFDHFSTVSCAPVLNTVTGESPLNRTWWSFCF